MIGHEVFRNHIVKLFILTEVCVSVIYTDFHVNKIKIMYIGVCACAYTDM